MLPDYSRENVSCSNCFQLTGGDGRLGESICICLFVWDYLGLGRNKKEGIIYKDTCNVCRRGRNSEMYNSVSLPYPTLCFRWRLMERDSREQQKNCVQKLSLWGPQRVEYCMTQVRAWWSVKQCDCSYLRTPRNRFSSWNLDLIYPWEISTVHMIFNSKND